MKHMERLKKLTSLAIKLGWMVDDPFKNHKRNIIKKKGNVWIQRRLLQSAHLNWSIL